MYFRIQNPISSVVNVEDATRSTKLLAQTTLRNVLGTKSLSEILMEREQISQSIQAGFMSSCFYGTGHSLEFFLCGFHAAIVGFFAVGTCVQTKQISLPLCVSTFILCKVFSLYFSTLLMKQLIHGG